VPATIECRMFVFGITELEFTELLFCLCACSATMGCTHCPPQVHLYQFIACYMYWLLWKTFVRELRNTKWYFQYSTVKWLCAFQSCQNMQQETNQNKSHNW